MRLLYYNELDYSKVEKNFKKIEKFLAGGDFRSAEVKKMENTDFYRAKLDDTNRLLFKFAKYEGNTYLLLLEVILNHNYDKSRFLRGAKINDEKFSIITDVDKIEDKEYQPLKYVNKNIKHFHVLDKIVSLDEEQIDIYNLPTPLIIIGSAGSGKTILTLEKVKTLKGRIAYISLSEFLVETAQNIYYSNNYENEDQEVDFLSFKEFYQTIQKPKGAEIQYRNFEAWYSKYMMNSKIKESFKLFEEFKGVLTGSVTETAYLSLNDYLSLGVKQSIFLKDQREDVYKIFEKYLQFLNESAYYDTNILSFNYLSQVQQIYDFIVIDEVQDITNIQLKLILNSLKIGSRFILSGDSNQIVHPNFFSWSRVKTMFYNENQDNTIYRILKTNYRNSKNITQLSNTLIKIKNVRFGSIDKESTYLIDSVSTENGEIVLLDDNTKIKNDLNTKTQHSTKYAVLVMNNEDKKMARQFFKTPLIFSIQEAKGLEYDNIILYNFITQNEKEFFEITRGVDESMLVDELKYARAKNKEDKDLEVYKFYINSLYVAFTRSIKNIYIIEKDKRHKILELLKLRETTQPVKIETQKSNEEDWLKEARKLELQGKYEQAQEIRDRIMGIEYISPEALKELEIIALDPTKKEEEVKRERKDLYRYAEARKMIETVDALAKLGFQRAIVYMKDVHKYQKEFSKDCRLDRLENLSAIIKKYNIDFRSDKEGMTGLMLACHHGTMKIFNYFISKNANILLRNTEGLNPMQIALRSYIQWTKANISNKPNFLTFNKLEEIYPKVKVPFVKYEVDNKIFKVNSHTMEYFLINYIITFENDFNRETALKHFEYREALLSIRGKQGNEMLENFEEHVKNLPRGLTMDNFMEFIEIMPLTILPEYRKKRNYVNAFLANNECDKPSLYNKKIFKRTGRGTYMLNPNLKIL